MWVYSDAKTATVWPWFCLLFHWKSCTCIASLMCRYAYNSIILYICQCSYFHWVLSSFLQIFLTFQHCKSLCVYFSDTSDHNIRARDRGQGHGRKWGGPNRNSHGHHYHHRQERPRPRVHASAGEKHLFFSSVLLLQAECSECSPGFPCRSNVASTNILCWWKMSEDRIS